MRSQAAFALTVVAALGSPSGMTAADEEKPQAKSSEPRRGVRVNISGSEVFFSQAKGDPQIFHYMVSRAVQREIGLTDEQAEKVDAIIRREGNQSNQVLLQLGNTRGSEERAKVWARLTSMCAAIDEHLKPVLEPAQVRRLTELQVQNMGLRALLIPEVAEALALSPAQRSRLNEILPPLVPMDTRYEDAIAATERARAEVEGSLTKEQRIKFRQMGGEPFDPEKHRAGDRENTGRR